MPHFNIEYSSSLDGRVDFGKLCRRVLREVVATGLFEEGGVRVRAIRCTDFAIADDSPENAFIDMSLRIGKGRSLDERKRTGDALFQAVVEELGDLFDTPHFALSLEIREIDPGLSWKRNTIHSRLRQQASRPGAAARE